MTDFSHARNLNCPECGTEYCDEEGYNCDCLRARVPFVFQGEIYRVLPETWDELMGSDKESLSHEDWASEVKEILQDAGLMERPKKEVNDQNGDEFLSKWQEAKKEIPPERMKDVYPILVGAMSGYIPREATERIISCVMAIVKR